MADNFKKLLKDLGIKTNNDIMKKFDIYYETLIKWNKFMNLTSIIEKEEVYIKHFFDSICLVKTVALNNQTILDVGSGAGFPSIPLKIIFPELKVTIIDSLNKRIKFLEELCTLLDVEVELIHGRAEEHKRRDFYDIVTARAVSRLNVLAELCIPFVKVNGHFISMKGMKWKEEIDEAKKAFKILGASLESHMDYDIIDNSRALIMVKKTEKTASKYPRIYGKIKKNPL